METKGQFTLLRSSEFSSWLQQQSISREIKTIQQHHTWIPKYEHFHGDNHFTLQESMKASHLERNFSDIAQHLTIFPDGKICSGRSMNIMPAGIKGANKGAVCIENLGNFDVGEDVMTSEQKESIIDVTATLLSHFNILPDSNSIICHHWYDLDSGHRTGGTGNTKSCPGTNFFGGNSVQNFNDNFIPAVKSQMDNNTIENHSEEEEMSNDINNPMTEEEKDDLFESNVLEINNLKIAAGGMVKSLIMELKRRDTYIKLHSAVNNGHKVNYIFKEGEQDLVFRLARALGFKEVTNDTLEVRNA